MPFTTNSPNRVKSYDQFTKQKQSSLRGASGRTRAGLVPPPPDSDPGHVSRVIVTSSERSVVCASACEMRIPHLRPIDDDK